MHPGSPQIAQLATEVHYHAHLRGQLLSEIPDLDEETLADTLEGASDLPDTLSAILRSALVDEALAGGLSTRIDDMKVRLERFRRRAESKRRVVQRAMTEAKIDKLNAPDFTASLKRAAPSLHVADETRVPPAYWKPQPPRLDRQGLLVALKAGTQIDGVSFADAELQLSVRTK